MKQYTPDSISPAILQHQEVPRSALWATIIGNALEWYDLIVYGFLAVFIAKQFFPDTDEAAALLATFATFALSYVVRPAAGVLIGLYADTAGRRKALMLIMGMMTVAMLIMVVVPPYSSIGLGATVLMVIARLLQAASAAGEFGSAAAYLLEAAPSRRRGLFSGLYSAGPQLACMLSAIVGLVLTIGMSEAVRDSWGWRIPFAVGLLIAPVGLYIRRYLPETNEFVATQLKPHGNPLAFFQGRMRTLLVGTALAGVANSASYILLIYAPTYVAKTLKLPIQFSFISLIVSGIAGTLFMPLMGALADRIGAKRQLNLGLGLMVVVIIPMYVWLTSSPSLERLLVSAVILAAIVSTSTSVFATLMTGLFPTESRSSGMSICYNISAIVFGATSLYFITLLTQKTGSSLIPAYYLFGIQLFILIVFSAFYTPAVAVSQQPRKVASFRAS